ncbi:phytoene/squalene synthase family protein [Methylocapsa acidiphila]|uniref:phytoene/squalene synthase family protein n=1 Tax=Methylocapsa acidiphila TaxID=133552 RepID=UPI00040789E0|nr:phytoene/squalene synthase family protein [Methylocapsa acidiphila]
MTDAAAAAPGADYSYCETLLRRDDPDRWLASLFAPREARPHIHALYAFSLEIARVREIVSEPLLGEIRFQWWRDALDAPDRADVAANPVAGALLDTVVRFDLSKQALLDLIDARLFDLYDDPMENMEQLDSYARATSSGLFRLARRILDQDEAAEGLGAAEHGGIAYALTGLLRALPWHCARGQVYVPRDILEKNGVEPAELVAGISSPGVLAALAELRGFARRHLEIFDTRLVCLPESARACFLPLSLCEAYLRRMEKPGYDPFKTPVGLPKWRRQWILWRAAGRWSEALR